MYYKISFMTEENLQNVLKSTKSEFLNGFKYAKTTKTNTVYGHKYLGSIGFLDPYVEQFLSNVKVLAAYNTGEKHFWGAVTHFC